MIRRQRMEGHISGKGKRKKKTMQLVRRRKWGAGDEGKAAVAGNRGIAG